MNMPASRNAQQGVTLFVGMMLLVLITLMVTSAFMLSNSNLRAVGNMQVKEEAIMAANAAIEVVLTSRFTDAPSADTISVDLNNDGVTDYSVAVSKPVCIQAAIDTQGARSSVVLSGMTSSSWNTVWDIEAVVNNVRTGANTAVNAGVRVLLSETQKNAVCS